jgi:lipopolysaccharide transport system ATP-binding protein
MSSTVIKVENVSKLYRLGEVGTGTISHDLNRWWAKMRGKEDPFAKIGETNDRTKKSESKYVWSLKDIDFEIKQGDAVGIIGRNGAGKSTLLKLLSKVTSPTTGKIKVKGRIASLLEVGTGFHPELTGRENIFLNGAILGMRKGEIKRKFDEIVDFSGVERYIDTPVKRYSSGMYVRLAFAVAAHLESEILIVDEVLAVGDAEFQKKCLGKMSYVSKGEGRTVLFVSHNMNAVRNLCSSGVLLNKGEVNIAGNIESVISTYERLFYLEENKFELTYQAISEKDIPFQIQEIQVKNKDGVLKPVFDLFESIFITVKYEVKKDLKGSLINFSVNNSLDTVFLSFDTDENHEYLDYRLKGIYEATIMIPGGILKPGQYFLNFKTGIANVSIIESIEKYIGFKVELQSRNDTYLSYAEKRPGIIAMPLNWKTSKIK